MEQPKVKPKGKVYICGAGPGDPDLLTLKAYKLLSKCDVILYDRLVNKRILKLASQHSKKVYVGRESGDPSTSQDITNELMMKYAQEGQKILRLKGGDPFIFGRGGEEAEFLSYNNIKFEIIPGVSSLNGAAVYAGIPLTHREHSSSVVLSTCINPFGRYGGLNTIRSNFTLHNADAASQQITLLFADIISSRFNEQKSISVPTVIL